MSARPLALEAAYVARERGWFPGHALYVDVHAHRQGDLDGAALLTDSVGTRARRVS